MSSQVSRPRQCFVGMASVIDVSSVVGIFGVLLEQALIENFGDGPK